MGFYSFCQMVVNAQEAFFPSYKNKYTHELLIYVFAKYILVLRIAEKLYALRVAQGQVNNISENGYKRFSTYNYCKLMHYV